MLITKTPKNILESMWTVLSCSQPLGEGCLKVVSSLELLCPWSSLKQNTGVSCVPSQRVFNPKLQTALLHVKILLVKKRPEAQHINTWTDQLFELIVFHETRKSAQKSP